MSLVSLISSGDNSILVIIIAGGSILEGEKGEENILISRGLSDGADGLVRLGTTQ